MFRWQQSQSDDYHLANYESDQGAESFIHEPVRMEANAEHVNAEPGKTGDYVPEHRQDS